MTNPMRAWSAWFSLSSQAALLGLEAQNVMALRFMRLASGGALAQSESARMVSEKILALGEAQTAAALATIKGGKTHHVTRKVMRVYKKRVRANRRRLTK
ncbi:MAG TPA: hypothetical protein VKG24_17865 [Pseudolabrys sp.]|nr:hypothetical protein [Pseudolabrys sp.]